MSKSKDPNTTKLGYYTKLLYLAFIAFTVFLFIRYLLEAVLNGKIIKLKDGVIISLCFSLAWITQHQLIKIVGLE